MKLHRLVEIYMRNGSSSRVFRQKLLNREALSLSTLKRRFSTLQLRPRALE